MHSLRFRRRPDPATLPSLSHLIATAGIFMKALMPPILCVLAFTLRLQPLVAQVPVIGFPVPQLSTLDSQMTQLMQTNNISLMR